MKTLTTLFKNNIREYGMLIALHRGHGVLSGSDQGRIYLSQ